MSDLDPRALRDAFGTFMTGVTVVTTLDAKGQPLGFTANSFSSVSLNPPLVLVCLANSSTNYVAFSGADGFAVNVLSETQKEVSNTFARPVEDRFSAVDWEEGPNGAPVLAGVSAWFDCSMFKTVEAGDHVILIGKVEAFEASPAPGLGYSRGAYVTSAAEAEALGQAANVSVSALIAHEGRVLLIDNGAGRLTLPEAEVGEEGPPTAVMQLIADCGVIAEPGFVYSVYEDDALDHQHISFLCHAAEAVSDVGVFTDLTQTTLMDIADPAMCTMLERFSQEYRMGNFGVYYGNQVKGQIRRMREAKLGSPKK